jgi:tetratricopeptide (TPR) repeat protein
MRVCSILAAGILGLSLLPAAAKTLPGKESKPKTAVPQAELEDDFLPGFAEELAKVRAQLADFTKRIKKTPKDAKLYFSRSQLYSSLGEHKKARADRIKAVELNPNAAAEAAQLEMMTPLVCDTEIAIGTEFLRRGKYEFAEIKFRSAQEADPQKPGGYIGLGVLYSTQKQYGKALENFAKAIEIKPDYEAGYYQRANTYLKMGQPSKALPDLSRVIEMSGRAEAYYVRSLAYKALKKTDKSEEDRKKATELDADVEKKVPAI